MSDWLAKAHGWEVEDDYPRPAMPTPGRIRRAIGRLACRVGWHRWEMDEYRHRMRDQAWFSCYLCPRCGRWRD